VCRLMNSILNRNGYLLRQRLSQSVIKYDIQSRRQFGHLVPLSKPPTFHETKKEVSLYIKGFISPGENADQFVGWKEAHMKLSKGDHQWGERAHGYNWASGSVNPIPIATPATTFWNLYRTGRVGLSFTPPGMAVLGAQELLVYTGRLYSQYQSVQKNLKEHAKDLSETLQYLADHFEHVRIVAHSLGCKVLVESIHSLPLHQRPHEIHMCAPAMHEEEVSDKLNQLAREHTFLYYCERDFMLNSCYALLHNQPAIGAFGLKGSYDGLKCIDVDKYFKSKVHFKYTENFHKFAAVKTQMSTPLSNLHLSTTI